MPLFTIKTLNTHAASFGDIPVQASFTAGGVEGSYATVRYRILTHEDFKVFLRADYVFNRGPGGGIDVDYCSKYDGSSFHAKNFAVRDRSYDNPDNRCRYRLEGRYDENFLDNRVKAVLTYDFLSDSEMGSDFTAKEFDLKTGGRTELLVSRREEAWIADFATRVRVNNFQTVNQELPCVAGGLRPISLGNTGLIFTSRARAAYLDYSYATGTPNVSDFRAARIEVNQGLYRPITFANSITVTPEAEFIGIFYGNNPNNQAVTQAIGRYGALATASFHKYFGKIKHVVEPYIEYQNYTFPTVSFNDYYVFNINDGYTGLQWMRYGLANAFYMCAKRIAYFNLWTYAFFNMHTMEKRVPKIYSSLQLDLLPCLTTQYDVAWNRETQNLEYLNLRHLWTINENVAINVDLLHRGPRAWRKADPTNFMLDALIPESELLNMEVSDQRDTFLAHLFYRFHPNWSFDCEARRGWYRNQGPEKETPYFEYQIDLNTIIGCNWHLKFSYEHREIDNRFTMGFKLGSPCPR